jgi:drug/metabolite transporter (DMT)-like permease
MRAWEASVKSDRVCAGIVSVLFSAFGFGLIPILALFAYETRISISTLLFCRFTLAAVIFALYHRVRHLSLKVTARDFGILFVLGYFCYAAQAYCYFSAVRFIPPSFASLLLYVFPLFVALLARVLDKEKITRALFMGMATSGAGLVLILGTAGVAADPRGVMFAIASAVGYACFVFFGHRTLARLRPLTLITYIIAFSALGFLSAGAILGDISFSFDPKAWLYVACLAVFSTIMSIGLLFQGIRILGPTRTSLLSVMEPVFTISLSALFLHDRLRPQQFIGALLVLGSVLIITVSTRHQEP